MTDVTKREPVLSAPSKEVDPAQCDPDASLFDRVSALIEQARVAVAVHANSTLTYTFWHVGRMVDEEVLAEGRAEYGKEIVVSLGRQLVAKYGPSYSEKNLRRMVQFAREFPDEQIVVSLGRQLSWTHIRALIPIKSPEARAYYINQVVERHLSVVQLRDAIKRKWFERREIASAQSGPGAAIPEDTFKDPMFLDTLGLHDGYMEADLEAAMVHGMEDVLMELGNGFTFVERQKRMIIDDIDYHLDLLFYSRPARRLVAVELKMGRFKAAYKGQMELYLTWLDRYERREGEEAPIGLILCPEAGREQIELLEMHRSGIAVVEYWTALPPKQELEDRLQIILRNARERLARRAVLQDEEDDIE